MIGIKDQRTSERLQLIFDLTLATAITMARQAETQAKEGKIIRQSPTELDELNRISQSWKKINFRQDKKNNQKESQCYRCGQSLHADKNKCPALNSVCRGCKKTGYWDRVCRARTVRCMKEADGVKTTKTVTMPFLEP